MTESRLLRSPSAGLLALMMPVVVLALLAIWLATDVDLLRQINRVTVRLSFLFFLAMVLVPLVPALQRVATRAAFGLGLAFVLCHGVHVVSVLTFALRAPAEFAAVSPPAILVPRVLGLLFLGIIAADLVLGRDRRGWRIARTVAVVYLWAAFLIGFGKRAGLGVDYAIFAGLGGLAGLGALAIVLFAWRKTS